MKMKFGMALAAVVMVAGCSNASETSADAPEVAAAEPAVVADGTFDTGVAECDAYLNNVMACIKDKVPEAQRKMMEDGINQSKASWANITDKAAMAEQCKAATEQAKTSFGAMGCTF